MSSSDNSGSGSSRDEEDEEGDDELDNETIDQVITSLNEDEEEADDKFDDLERQMNNKNSASAIIRQNGSGAFAAFSMGQTVDQK